MFLFFSVFNFFNVFFCFFERSYYKNTLVQKCNSKVYRCFAWFATLFNTYLVHLGNSGTWQNYDTGSTDSNTVSAKSYIISH